MSSPNILLVEDEQITAMEVQGMLEDMEYSVVDTVDTGQKAIEAIEENPVAVAIMDIRLDGRMDGIEITRKLKETFEDPPGVLYFSAYSDDQTLDRARDTNPAGFLIKPITKADLQSSIEVALGQA